MSGRRINQQPSKASVSKKPPTSSREAPTPSRQTPIPSEKALTLQQKPLTTSQKSLTLPQTNSNSKAHVPVTPKSQTKPATETQRAIVICGAAGIGKSTFITEACQKRRCNGKDQYYYNGYEVIDLDSSYFQGDTRYADYVKAIIKICKEPKDRVVLGSTHKFVVDELLKNGIKIILVYPKRDLQMEWVERIRRREEAAKAAGKPVASIFGVTNLKWDDWIDEYEKKDCPRYELSHKGANLQEVAGDVLDLFKKYYRRRN